jgi:hypothetical protein
MDKHSYYKNYLLNKFTRALTELATSPEPIQKRLADAYLHNLLYIEEEKLPEKIRGEFHDISICLSYIRPQNGEPTGSVVATTREMSTEEAADLAERFANIYDELLSIILYESRD